MLFFFDESGKFAVTSHPDNLKRLQASVVTGIAISEVIETEVRNDYETFVAELEDNEKINGEPKGCRLSNNSRKKICKMLEKYSGNNLLVFSLFMDTSLIPFDHGYYNAKNFSDRISLLSSQTDDIELREECASLSTKFSQLSDVQARRLITWALCLKGLFDKTIKHINLDSCNISWEKVLFVIDEVDTNKRGLEPELFLRFLHPWLSAYSRQYPSAAFEDILDSDNNFSNKYIRNDGVNFVNLLKGNVIFEDSKSSWGLQLADILSNIIFRALHHPDNKNEEIDIYRQLLRVCSFESGDTVKLFYASSSKEKLWPQVRKKYSHILNEPLMYEGLIRQLFNIQ